MREVSLPARGTEVSGFTQGWSDPRARAQLLSGLKETGRQEGW